MAMTEKTPSEVMKIIREAANQRTTLWGFQNETDDSVEIAFGRLTSSYNVPGYTKDTGTKLLIQNGAPGQGVLRDPIIDTGGVPIAATEYTYDAKIKETDQDLPGSEQAPAGEYIAEAYFTLTYEEGVRKTDKKKSYRLNVVHKYRKLHK
jgi:hypothetical protein